MAFGVTFAYPVIFAVAAKYPQHLPYTYRLEYAIGRRIIAPGLVVIILAGAYLASKEHVWNEFWVQSALWSSRSSSAGMGGMLFAPTERKIIEMAERDVAAAGGGEITFCAEHDAAGPAVADRWGDHERPRARGDLLHGHQAVRLSTGRAGRYPPEELPAGRRTDEAMNEHSVSRTLVKSPPELWAELSDLASLAAISASSARSRITRLEPEPTVAWEGEPPAARWRSSPPGGGRR